MKYYQIYPNDQLWDNRLIYTGNEKQCDFRLKPQYERFRCPKCKGIDRNAVFTEGFDSNIRIRAKGDIIETEDKFYYISHRVKAIIAEKGFEGVTLKPVSNSQWNVLNANIRVKIDPNVYEFRKPFCESCGKPREVTGVAYFISQLEVPQRSGVFFSPVFEGEKYSPRRDLFISDDIVRAFKENGIKGAGLTRLLDAEEQQKVEEAEANNKPVK